MCPFVVPTCPRCPCVFGRALLFPVLFVAACPIFGRAKAPEPVIALGPSIWHPLLSQRRVTASRVVVTQQVMECEVREWTKVEGCVALGALTVHERARVQEQLAHFRRTYACRRVKRGRL